jgi:PhzF family phenazine biosynthesis protein
MTRVVHLLDIFAAEPGGGNPCPTVIDADGMSDTDMQRVAQAYGHESGFVLPAQAESGCDFEFRFWVPQHEMEMCGHATVGAVWLLNRLGRLPRDEIAILTRSGRVEARVVGADAAVEVSQPLGQVSALPDADRDEADILSVLNIDRDALAPLPIRNARTSRVKTLVPVRSEAILDGLRPDFARVEALCARIGSTGLYPYAPVDTGAGMFAARQFPKSSGYPEDAATGIAAAALAFGLLEAGMVAGDGRPLTVRQGWAMGRPSAIRVRFRTDGGGAVTGCWLGGSVRLDRVAEFA